MKIVLQKIRFLNLVIGEKLDPLMSSCAKNKYNLSSIYNCQPPRIYRTKEFNNTLIYTNHFLSYSQNSVGINKSITHFI